MKILLAGGGTLGSVTPLLAVVEELAARHPDWAYEWWGTETGPEAQLIRAQGIEYRSIASGKFRRYADSRTVTDAFGVARGFLQALWRFGAEVRPAAVLTAGSYAAVPVAWAAWLYRIPVFMHQQDVRIGLANKLMRPFASRVTATFESSRQFLPEAVRTGNPVRRQFMGRPLSSEARIKFGFLPGVKTVTVIGGGTGAAALNTLAQELPRLLDGVQVLHIAGRGKATGIALERYVQLEFTSDTLSALAAADVVVTRAGMATLTELAALEKACVIVPIPDSHQEDNAAAVRQAQAGAVLGGHGLTAEILAVNLSKLLSDKAQCEALGSQLNRLLFVHKAAQRIADLVENTAVAGK